MEREEHENAAIISVRRAVYEAVVTRGKDGISLRSIMDDNIRVVWPGSTVPATEKMVQLALDYLTDEGYISGGWYSWSEVHNRAMGKPKDTCDPH
jgi:hypothetical protein